MENAHATTAGVAARGRGARRAPPRAATWTDLLHARAGLAKQPEPARAPGAEPVGALREANEAKTPRLGAGSRRVDPGLVEIVATFLVLIGLGLLAKGLEATLMWLL